MKILMTTDNIGGVWTYALELANGLRKSGVEVNPAVIGDPLTDSQRKELQGFRYFHFEAKQEWMNEPWDDVQKTGEWLLEVKNDINPDIGHLNSYSLAALQWNVPVAVVLHSCVLTWWKAVKKENAPSDWDVYRDKISKGIRSADTVVAPSSAMLKSAEELYGPFKNKKLIYNGRDPQLFKKGKKEKFIFSMGRVWDEAKNIKLVSEAAANIRYKIFVAGDYRNDEFRLKSNIFLLGRLNPEQVSDWLSDAAVYLLPVKYEPFGYTFLEAAFSGCALVGGNIDSLREIWGDAMLYTDTEDAEQVALTVNELLDDDQKLQLMRQKAYNRAVSMYTSEKMTQKYLSLYNSHLKHSKIAAAI